MSEINELPVSESLIITGFGMLIGMIGGCLSCILKSRCQRIQIGCISCERDVIPSQDIQNVNISMPNNTTSTQ